MIMMMTKIISFIVIRMILGIGSIECLQLGGRWKQLGNAIDGVTEFGFLGHDVTMSSDGSTIAICTFEDDTTTTMDFVRAYSYNPLFPKWEQMGTDIVLASGCNSLAMSADGKMIVVGLPFNDNANGSNSGVGQVYAFDSTIRNWIQIGSDLEGVRDLQRFGWSAAMSADGKKIALSANDMNSNYIGSVSVFVFNSITKEWVQDGFFFIHEREAQLIISSIDLSADGKTIAIGVANGYKDDDNIDAGGYVRVYSYSSVSKQWALMGPDIFGEAQGDFSGISIALSANGKTIAIGAVFNDGNGFESGHVRVYSFDTALGRWKQIGGDIDGEAPGDFFGSSVDLSDDGKTVAIGAIGNSNPNSVISGHVRVYSYVAATKIWTQIGKDINGIKDLSLFGESLAMSADGSTIIIGAPYGDTDHESAGYVRVYKYKPSTACTVSWKLYNLQNKTIVDLLVNGIKIRKPPPCGYANIEAFIPCTNTTSHAVTMELYDNQGKLYKRRTDAASPYFLYGKYGNIKAGTYKIRAIVNSTVSPFTSVVSPYTKFTLLGTCA